MSEFETPSLPERNPETHQKHRREVFWQITFPVLAGGIVLLAVLVIMIWAGLSGTGDLSKWGDVSLIWLILPVLVVSLLFLAILGGLVYAVIMLLRMIPPYAHQTQKALENVREVVKRGADTTVEPVLRVRSVTAGLRALLRSLSPQRRPRRKDSGSS